MNRAGRRTAARIAQLELKGRRIGGLAAAMLRADAATEAGRTAFERVLKSGLSDDELVAGTGRALRRQENSDLTRASALLCLGLATVYEVALKWKLWNLGKPDDEVAQLLESPHFTRLKKYRHVIFHVDVIDENDSLAFWSDPSALEWFESLSACLRGAVADWYQRMLPESRH